jgi:hypothetical protein
LNLDRDILGFMPVSLNLVPHPLMLIFRFSWISWVAPIIRA